MFLEWCGGGSSVCMVEKLTLVSIHVFYFPFTTPSHFLIIRFWRNSKVFLQAYQGVEEIMFFYSHAVGANLQEVLVLLSVRVSH